MRAKGRLRERAGKRARERPEAGMKNDYNLKSVLGMLYRFLNVVIK